MKAKISVTVILASLALSLAPKVIAAQAVAAELPRPDRIPQACQDELFGLEPAEPEIDHETEQALWNRLYLQGVIALTADDLPLARQSFCAALEPAASFGPRDWRFAETLDELGLTGFLDADLDFAETMQGAAVAEMLLALGPDTETSVPRPGRQAKLSSVAIYADRLAWIHDRQGDARRADEARARPHRILDRGYIPLGRQHQRLDWLASQYLLDEDFATAAWILELKPR